MSNDDTTIHVGDPRWDVQETILVTRGDVSLYLRKWEDDTSYAVLDEDGDDTGHTWRGGIDGIADFTALGDLFDVVKESNA